MRRFPGSDTLTASQTFNWFVTAGVVTLTNPGDQTNSEGDTVSLQLSATDSNNSTLSYQASGLPSGLSINSTTGLISGSVSSGDAANGPYTVTVMATDTQGNSSAQQFTWNVNPVNLNPVVSNPGAQINAQGDVLSLQISATDPAGNGLTYSASGLPSGLTINPSSGLISGVLSNNSATVSPYSVTVTATDGANSGSATFTWSVTNQAVTVMNPGTQSNTGGDAVSLQINAYDPAQLPLTYSAGGLPNGLSIDPNSGLISGTVATTDGGSYSVTVMAGDSQGNSGSATFTWNVAYINQAPTLDNPGDQLNKTGDAVSVQLSGSDVDGDTVTYSATGLPTGLSIDPTTGIISGTLPASAGSSTPYSVTVTASDGTLTASQTFNWFVTAGVVTLTNPGDQTNSEGDTVSLQLSATDSNNSTLSYQASGLPSGLSINSSSGLISGSVASGDSANGPYTVTVMATDTQGNSSAQQFTWNVNAPANSLTLTNPGNQSNAAGNNVSLQVQANDPDGDSLTYTAGGLPPGLMIDPSTGIISGTVDYSAAQMNGGVYKVTVMVDDGNGDYAAQTFSWTVSYTGQGPWLDDPPTEYNNQGDKVALSLVAGSPDGKALSYSASGLPSGLTVNPTTGLISGTITAAVGQYTVTAAVTEGTEEAKETFLWQVSADAPVNTGDKPVLKAVAGSDKPGGKFGVFALPISWQVSGNSNSGVILQRIQVEWNVHWQRGPSKAENDPAIKPAGFQKLYARDWYEAWIVQRGGDGKNNIQPMGTPDAGTLKLLEDAGVKLPSEEDIKKMNDWFFQTDPGGPKKTTYGSLTITGSATFYEGMTEAQLKMEKFQDLNSITGAGKLLSYRMDVATNRNAIQPFLDRFKVKSAILKRVLVASWGPGVNDGQTKVELTDKTS